jgi:hypothetical protein
MIARTRVPEPPPSRLQPAGRRWGFGAHSVVPYLVHAPAEARPDPGAEDGAIRNPVFPHMDQALRALRRSH